MTTPSELQKIITALERIHSDGKHAFRGQESFKFNLSPSAFRPATISQMKLLFNAGRSNKFDNWCKSEEIKEHIDLWLPGARRDPNAIIIIRRLLEYCFYLMILNHSVNVFAQSNHSRISAKDRETLQLRGIEFWRDEKTFRYLFTSYFPRVIQRYDLQGDLIQDANPFEDLTGIDESLPQHYGTPTAALDWSYNPLVAIYFGLGNRNITSDFLTIYALKIHDDVTDSPIKFIDKSIYIENIRAEKQEGTFTYFTKPCSFFLRNGELPSINFFDVRQKNGLDKSRFDLNAFRIERTNQNIKYLSDMLDEMGINKDHLFPDLCEEPSKETI